MNAEQPKTDSVSERRDRALASAQEAWQENAELRLAFGNLLTAYRETREAIHELCTDSDGEFHDDDDRAIVGYADHQIKVATAALLPKALRNG